MNHQLPCPKTKWTMHHLLPQSCWKLYLLKCWSIRKADEASALGLTRSRGLRQHFQARHTNFLFFGMCDECRTLQGALGLEIVLSIQRPAATLSMAYYVFHVGMPILNIVPMLHMVFYVLCVAIPMLNTVGPPTVALSELRTYLLESSSSSFGWRHCYILFPSCLQGLYLLMVRSGIHLDFHWIHSRHLPVLWSKDANHTNQQRSVGL